MTNPDLDLPPDLDTKGVDLSLDNAETPSSNAINPHHLSSTIPSKFSQPTAPPSSLSPPSTTTTTTTPAPTLKSARTMNRPSTDSSSSNPRKRNLTPSSFSVEFSSEVLSSMAMAKKKDADESDTDVGSNDCASYDFNCEEDSVNPYERTPEMNNCYSVSRVGAKVRRLDLSGGDVKTCSFASGAALGSVLESPVKFGSPRGSTRSVGKSTELTCPPPSTAKKGPVSRLMLNNLFDEREEDDSPRDPSEFPFFAESPTDKSEGVMIGKENKSEESNTKSLGWSDSVVSYDMCSPSSPKCPPTTTKKTNRRNLSPPRNLKSHGRANSFLQMFSQEPLVDDEEMAPSSPKCPPTAMKKLSSRSLSPPKSLKAHGRAGSFLQMFSQEPLVDADDEDMANYDTYTLKSPNELRGCSISPPKSSIVPQKTTSFSRFVADFEVVGTLGNGSFGCVYKVRNRMDKRMYAIKAAKREARGKSDRDRMLQEVYALAALSDETTAAAMHIVRYHQAWMEGNRLYIQTELCDGSLEREMEKGTMDEKRRYKVLREMSLALDLVHKSGMIHLDIKPENIFIRHDQYKLGDFGLVSKIENHDDVEEGDSRYMSMELLSGDLDDLTKSDIFSLGATMYEICLGRPLPENGQEWQDIRQGILQPMQNTPFELQMIVRTMLAPEKEDRPSAADLLKKRQLMSSEQQQLIVERNKANAANMALNQMQRIVSMSPRKKFHRSNTVS